jgi:hypothetical protein
MEIIELIRNAESAPKVLSALSAYIQTLPHVAAIPEWLLRLPLKGADDVAQRMAALATVVNLCSQNLLHRETSIAKNALRVFAAATWRLRARKRPGPPR